MDVDTSKTPRQIKIYEFCDIELLDTVHVKPLEDGDQVSTSFILLKFNFSFS